MCIRDRFSLRGMKSYDVARYGIEQALKGKLIIIPGVQMKLSLIHIFAGEGRGNQ